MKILVRILLGLIGLGVVLAIALAVAVAVLLDPEEYRPLLAESVEQSTGRKLTLAGELDLKLFPCCSITLGKAALGNPPDFPAGDFASVESAELSLKIWPLLFDREVRIGTVRLDGLNANLLVRRDGRANWEFGEGGAEPGEAAAESGEASDLLKIDGIEISGGRIAWRDEQDPAAYLVEDLELVTSDIQPGEPFDLQFGARLTDESDGTTGKVSLKARAQANKALNRFSLEKPAITLDASGAAIPAKSMALKLGAAELVVDVEKDTAVSFRGLEGEFDLKNLEDLAGDASGSFIAGDTRLDMASATTLGIPELSLDATVSGSDIPGGSVATVSRFKGLALEVDSMDTRVESFTSEMTGLGGRMTLTGGGRLSEKNTTLSGSMQLEPLSPRSVLAVLKEPEPKTADPKALTSFGGRAAWLLGQDSLQLKDMDFKLDDTRITGTLDIANFDKPATRFDVKLDAMDLDRYLEPESAGGEGQGETGKAGSAPAEDDIPLETIRDLRLNGRLQADRLTYAGISMAAVDVNVRAADGRLQLDPLKAQVYGGSYSGSIGIDATGPVAKLTTEQNISALQAGQLLKQLTDKANLSGALSGSIRATGTGNSTDALMRTLSGNLALNLADGAYLGTDLWHEIRSARARIKGEAPPPAPADPRTAFNALEMAGTLGGGALNTGKLLAEIPFIRLTGQGSLDYVDKNMDYQLAAQVYENPTFEDGTTIKDLAGLTLPMTLKGPMDSPKVSVDIKGLATSLATGAAAQKLRDRLYKKLGGEEDKPATTPAEGESATDGSEPAEQQPAEPEKPRDALKRTLRDLLKPPQ